MVGNGVAVDRTEDSADFRYHTSLALQHAVFDIVVDETLKKGDIKAVFVSFELLHTTLRS